MTGPTQVLVASAPDHPEALGGALDILTDEEHERIGRFLRPADAASFAGGRALVRLALARLLGASPRELVFDTWCERHSSAHGKPRLVEPPAEVEFSLSRAGSRLNQVGPNFCARSASWPRTGQCSRTCSPTATAAG